MIKTGSKTLTDLLVGSTGFVGGNLMRSHEFEANCHSTNVNNYYDTCPELCVYAGVPAAMFLANKNPEADLAVMRDARENIRRIKPERLVLISTIAVYLDSSGKDENATMQTDGLSAYGANRLQLENWIREDFPDALIIRLPALYGVGLKKNFLYDLHTITPAMLTPKKFEELSLESNLVKASYELKSDGFYHVSSFIAEPQVKEIRDFFKKNSFNALSFTDSRSRYQFYNLSRLWNDINKGLENKLALLNLCTPPVSAQKVYECVTGDSNWSNEISDKTPFDYDLRSSFAEKISDVSFNGYLYSEEYELNDIVSFMKAWVD